jgi:hypothetical protein
MFMHVDHPSAELNDAADQIAHQIAQERRHHRDILNELIDIGAAMARMIAQQAADEAEAAKSEKPPAPTCGENLTVSYERTARAVRRTIMLYEKLLEPPKSAASPVRNRIAARKKILRDVEDIIQRKAQGEHAEALRAELLDRLDSPDLDDEIATREIPEIVTDITRDLGIAHMPGTHPWKRRVPRDIALLNARAQQIPGTAPSENLAALLAAAPPIPASPPPIDRRNNRPSVLDRLGPIPDS